MNIYIICGKKYNMCVLSYEEIWYNMFEKLHNFVNDNNKLPSTADKYSNIKQLGQWLGNQNNSFKK